VKILFIGKSNAGRSQIAEGLAKRAFGPQHSVQSAGLYPTERSPLALRALQEIGIDITHQTAKSLAEISLVEMDCVVALDAELPSLPSETRLRHWPIPDPSFGEGSEQVRMERFRDTRELLERRIALLAAELLPVAH
jgi:arsenate reductase (thioredoxin)